MVDKEDQVHVSRQEFLQESDGPLFEGLWQHSVVRVRERVVDNVPRLGVVQLLLVDQNPEQLDDGQRWVGVVELDGALVGEVLPLAVLLEESPYYIA